MPTSALQVARTGLEAQDARMRVIANNLANVGTTGFKRDRANFATLAYQDARVAGQRSSGETAYATGLNLGTGVAVQSTSQIMTQGALNNTDNAFDLALDGDGYFQVEMPGGQIGYTRAGNFTLSAEGQLVTQQGYAVQPAITSAVELWEFNGPDPTTGRAGARFVGMFPSTPFDIHANWCGGRAAPFQPSTFV